MRIDQAVSTTAARSFVLGSAGHIDHGKTALVRALTGVDTDRLPAEKARGITIDLGFAQLDLGTHRLAIVDVPGHERFIRNMLAGATGLDLAMLVIAADDSIMPQTREHVEILSLLKLKAGVVAITKCDLVDSNWLGLVDQEVRDFLTGTFLESAPIIYTSATENIGISALKEALAQTCERLPVPTDPGLFRLAVDRVFTVAGHGTVVTGTVASGVVDVGDELECWPGGKTVRVRGLQRHDQPCEQVARGMRAALNLTGIHHTEIVRGDELATPGFLKPSRVLTAELQVSPLAPRPLRHRQRYKLHLGTRDTTITLSLIDSMDAAGNEARLCHFLSPLPIVATSGQPFVLREESPAATVAGGRILEPTASRLRRRDLSARSRLEARRNADPQAVLLGALAANGIRPLSPAAFARESGLPLGQIQPLLDDLVARGQALDVPVAPRRTSRVAATLVQEFRARVLKELSRQHAARPRHSAIPRADLIAALSDIGSDTLVSHLIDSLVDAGLIRSQSRCLSLKSHEPTLTHSERKLKQLLAERIRSGGMTPPTQSELTAEAVGRASLVSELLRLLADEDQIVEIGDGLWLARDVESEVRRRVVERLGQPGEAGLTMADLRDLLGTTRKYAVPIGEYLDRIGLTQRIDDRRILGEPGLS